MASYFGLCVWLVPFSLFVSLSASDNVLPTMGHEMSGPGGGTASATGGSAEVKGRQGMAKALVDFVRESITDVGRLAGWQGRRREDL